MNADVLLQLYGTSTQFLRWALFAWILAIAISLGLDPTLGATHAETLYQIVSLAGLLGLVLFGVLNVYFGVFKDFSATQILITAAALLVGGVGISAVSHKQGIAALATGGLLFLVGMAALWRWQARRQKAEAAAQAIARPLDDATIRGGASIFKYGHDAYRLVERNSTGRNTPAERFEKKLIRYIERKLEVQPLSMKGTNASYWSFRLKAGGHVELVVIGPGYNTSAKLGDNERWLLRIREAKPGFFGNWMAKHFPDGAGVTRDLGTEIQIQFASSKAVDERRFFDQDIEAPVVGVQIPLEAAIGLLDYLEQSTGKSGQEGDESVKPAKATLH